MASGFIGWILECVEWTQTRWLSDGVLGRQFCNEQGVPNDFDACWDEIGVDVLLIDPVLLEFDRGRTAQKAKFRGEFFPASSVARMRGDVFLDFFQVDRETGQPKGIVALDLGGIE